MTTFEGFVLIGLVVLSGVVIEQSWRIKSVRQQVKTLIDLKTITEGMIAAIQSMDTEKDERIGHLEDMFARIGFDPDENHSLGHLEDIANAIDRLS